MPADETKITIYHPKVAPDPRELAAASDEACKEEEETTALAIRIACEDPTERDHLSGNVSRARSRLKAAASELVRALVALLFAWFVRMILDRSRKKVTAVRGEIGRAECGVLALERLFGRFWVRKVLRRRTLIRMLGARGHTDDDDRTVYSLKLAERRYREGDGFGAHHHGSATDSPIVRVILGVKISASGEPAWCLKRFVRTDTGGFREIHCEYKPDAQSLLVSFYTEPSPTTPTTRPAQLAAVAEGTEVMEGTEEPPEDEEHTGQAA